MPDCSIHTLNRLPQYLSYLRSLPAGTQHVSATQIAEAVGRSDVLVRKDLAAVSRGGRPRTGYETAALLHDLETLLRCEEKEPFVIVGLGQLGGALARYGGFAEYNLRLAALFDTHPALVGSRVNGLPVHHPGDIGAVCAKTGARVAILTAPAAAAQGLCSALAAAGIRLVWNFAPVHLAAPEGVTVENANLAASLGLLSRHLQEEEHKNPAYREGKTG